MREAKLEVVREQLEERLGPLDESLEQGLTTCDDAVLRRIALHVVRHRTPAALRRALTAELGSGRGERPARATAPPSAPGASRPTGATSSRAAKRRPARSDRRSS